MFNIWHTLNKKPHRDPEQKMQSILVLGWSKNFGYELIFYDRLNKRWVDEYGNYPIYSNIWQYLPEPPKNDKKSK